VLVVQSSLVEGFDHSCGMGAQFIVPDLSIF